MEFGIWDWELGLFLSFPPLQVFFTCNLAQGLLLQDIELRARVGERNTNTGGINYFIIVNYFINYCFMAFEILPVCFIKLPVFFQMASCFLPVLGEKLPVCFMKFPEIGNFESCN